MMTSWVVFVVYYPWTCPFGTKVVEQEREDSPPALLGLKLEGFGGTCHAGGKWAGWQCRGRYVLRKWGGCCNG